MIDDAMVERVAKDVLAGRGTHAEIGNRHGCSEKSVERIAGLLKILGREAATEPIAGEEGAPPQPAPAAFDPKAAEKRSRLKALLGMVADGLDPQVMSRAEHPYDQLEANALANYVDEVDAALERGAEVGDEVETQIRERYQKLSRRVITLANAEARLRTVQGQLGQAERQLREKNDEIAAADDLLENRRAELLGLRVEIEEARTQTQAAEDEFYRWVDVHDGAEAMERELQSLQAVVLLHGLEGEVATARRVLAARAPLHFQPRAEAP